MRHSNPFANRRQQSARARRRAAEPSQRQARRIVIGLRASAAREIKKGLTRRIAALGDEDHDVRIRQDIEPMVKSSPRR